MDPVRNPFAPGAGSPPPELAGREDILVDADTALRRAMQNRPARSQILLGLRGTGKTVLLTEIARRAEEIGHVVSQIEAPENRSLPELLYPRLQQALRKLSLIESAKAASIAGFRALRSFAGTFKISVGDFSVVVDPEPGVADSGNLEYDLSEVFLRVGDAAQAASRAWTLLIDEVQYLSQAELSALIVAMHNVNQRQKPIVFFGAGLPQLAALSGEAKSYAERLFNFPTLGPLDQIAAASAIRRPIEDEGEEISNAAVAEIVLRTHGYPYFLQEWGYQTWNVAAKSPIGIENVRQATIDATRRLDQGFFRVRFDRLTPKERDYAFAMASLGQGPYRSSAVAAALGEDIAALGPRRAAIIRKGMIYSPAHGDIAFTVPMFDEFLHRTKAF